MADSAKTATDSVIAATMRPMGWIARIDARAAAWPSPARWLFMAMKWLFVAVGAWAWVGLWFQRDFWLGMTQLVLIGYVIWRDYWPRPAPPPSPDQAP